jgi:hypothetical protein
MPYFKTRDVAAVAVCAAFWGILNVLIGSIFKDLTGLPFGDLIAFMSLTLVVWWTRKFGAATLTGLVVAALTLLLKPSMIHVLAFVPASLLFDAATRGIGYRNCLDRMVAGITCIVLSSTLSAWFAGVIIGSFFMDFKTLLAILTFAGSHAITGVVGGAIGFTVVRALAAKKLQYSTSHEATRMILLKR